MALNASKTILLEKQYLYVKASKGFQLEGTNIERIWVNTGYYRFLVDNVAKALSNSYVNVLYDSTDIDFIAYCSDLFMEEIQNSVVTAVENLETYLQQFAQQNHDDFGAVQDTIDELSDGLSTSMQAIVSILTDEPIGVYKNSDFGSSLDFSSYDYSFSFQLFFTSQTLMCPIDDVAMKCKFNYTYGVTNAYLICPNGVVFKITTNSFIYIPRLCGVYKVVYL